ncbi:MAG: carbohydrate kinase family protein [Erysipelotrichaceae bacterium]
MNTVNPNILVFGVSIMDIFGFVDYKYAAYDSNPGCVQTSFGGVCRNIAENLTKVGINTKFISILGDDNTGKSMLQHARNIGLDMEHSLVVANATTPTYMAILNEAREMVSAVVDMKIVHHMTPEFIDSKKELIQAADFMILDCDSVEITEYIVTTYHKDTKMILDPVSGAKARAVKHLLPYFHTIKPNRHEASAFCGFPVETMEDVRKAGAYFLSLGIEQVFISLDVDGVYYINNEEEGIVSHNPIDVLNVTGAGDAFVAGLGYGYLHQSSTLDCIKFAIGMSIATITHEETIHPFLSEEFIQNVMKTIQWDVATFEK